MSMYNKIHEVIRQKAVEENNKELVDLIDKGKKQKLLFIYAYNKKWNEKEPLMPYIEIFDEFTFRKYNIRLFIVRNSNETKVNNERIVLTNETKECATYSIKDFKKLAERFKKLYDFTLLVEKIDLKKLPIMCSY